SSDALPATAPQAGDRFPWLRLKFAADRPVEDIFQRLGDMHFNLVLIGQPEIEDSLQDSGDLLCIHVIPADAVNNEELARRQIPQPSFYLIRPDGYIGLCGTRLQTDALTDYFVQHLHLLTPRTVGNAA